MKGFIVFLLTMSQLMMITPLLMIKCRLLLDVSIIIDVTSEFVCGTFQMSRIIITLLTCICSRINETELMSYLIELIFLF